MADKTCPICGKKLEPGNGASTSAPHFPFCSKRCRDTDLNRWFSEGYTVPVETERVLGEALADFEDELPDEDLRDE